MYQLLSMQYEYLNCKLFPVDFLLLEIEIIISPFLIKIHSELKRLRMKSLRVIYCEQINAVAK